MGVYLSEPNTNKHLKEGKKDAMAFVSGEMQGIIIFIEAGGKVWKMLPYINWILEMGIVCLLFLMVMEVPNTVVRFRSQLVCSGYLY